ncbi:Myb/SANT-like DNA-binding domain [Popillia japonica]|uniref:Regulatory protein zeste n=1 Tax=Popillia japonica TaxID=7064 RepID=A0AAW1MD18_POPJA
MATPGRRRGTNFTQREEAFLTNAVKMYASAIESRKTDADNNIIRNDAWDRVCNIYNQTSGEKFRDVAILKNKYKNMKKSTAKNLADEKKHIYKTGGGPPKEYTFSQTDRDIIEISGEQMTGQVSEIDAVYMTPISVEQIVPHEEDDLDMIHLGEYSKVASKRYNALPVGFRKT